ncbi:MAG: DUF692 domain-containing protein [Sphingomonadaceae bacterium]|nr:DUF692 domain-containing protein [Sphingomonadaceae bacterium]
MTIPIPLPPSAGIGLKPQHYRDVLSHAPTETTASRDDGPFRPGWFEVHPQNYFCDGGPPHNWLTAIAELHPLSFHSVGLSLGSAGGLNTEELAALVRLCDRYEPAMVSDHLSWSGTANCRYPDLLPVPYTHECLNHFADQVGRAQDALGREILVENPSRYLAFSGDEMDETQFLSALCRKAGCGILFDINNIEVSAANLGLDPWAMVDAVNADLVGEIHLAGHAVEHHADGALLIDDHGSAITELTWQLFRRFIERAGAKPVLIEWDTNIPDYAVLTGQAQKAGQIIREAEMRNAA